MRGWWRAGFLLECGGGGAGVSRREDIVFSEVVVERQVSTSGAHDALAGPVCLEAELRVTTFGTLVTSSRHDGVAATGAASEEPGDGVGMRGWWRWAPS